MYTKFQTENIKEGQCLGDLDVDGRIILKLISQNRIRGCEMDLTGSG
jgi:hypothetical protein